jgi:hypothetical protein
MMREATARSLGSAVAVAAAAFAGASLVQAAEVRRGHSEYLASLSARSLSEGVGRETLPLITPAAGPGRTAVARRLLALVGGTGSSLGSRLVLGDLKPSPTSRRSVAYVGDKGYVEVHADGTKLRVRGNIDDPKELEKAGSARLEKVELESLGQRFVKDSLKEFVRLGTNESLTFLGARYLVNSGGEVERNSETHQVVASIAVFGREVDGVPVVGSGSKVAVWFDGARQPVGFDVDWPVFRMSGRSQRVLAPGALAERVAKTTVPPRGSDVERVLRYECGYVDLGATRRGEAIQAGCSIAWESSRGDSVSAHSEFVPAGEPVLKERRWPLASLVAAGRILNTRSPEFLRYLGGPKPPRDAPPAKAPGSQVGDSGR